jgi:hypothetical protein
VGLAPQTLPSPAGLNQLNNMLLSILAATARVHSQSCSQETVAAAASANSISSEMTRFFNLDPIFKRLQTAFVVLVKNQGGRLRRCFAFVVRLILQ